ncbi:ABC transporter [Phytophthora megakarya]|uniref:ABC transporter n=1 Tax=Phytophthora megakarya TaxID=4795 RepID=A0A225WKI9_9STRA|nr:ABC transporter [Phytophthora megakarya]
MASSASPTSSVSTLRWRAVQGKNGPGSLGFGTGNEEIYKKLDRDDAKDDGNCRLLLPEAPQLTLEWQNLALRVSVANEPGVTEKVILHDANVILHDANGVAKPGELLAIMGPSGAGKSSLLDCLSGRNVNVEGEILVNGVQGWTPKLRKLVAYAMQDELFHSTLTVREHLVFQARLRLGGQVSKKQCLDRVNAVIEELGLTACRDTLIGERLLRGISGGEKKRLAFASEILTNPAVLFVDEPTSGLDSCMARAVVEQLKKLAAKRTVVTAIHQPSSEVYALFDRLYLLVDGATVFEGSACNAIAHFATLGLPCPQFMNPADHFMEQLVVLERASDNEGLARVQRLKDVWAGKLRKQDVWAGKLRKQPQQVSRGETRAGICTTKLKSVDQVDVVIFEVEGRDDQGAEYDYESGQLPLWGQVEVLAHRNWLRLVRDPMAFRLQVLQTLIFSFLLGLIYFQLQVDQKGMRNFSGAFFYIVTDQVYSASMPAIISVPLELPIVYRELDVGLYRIGAWFLAKNLCELPSQLALPTLNLIPIYVLMFGFFGPGFFMFMQMLALLMAMNSSCVAFGYAISCICRRVDIAPIVGNIMIMPLLLLGGMFVDPERVPVMFRWLELVTPFKYGYFGFMRAFWRNVSNVPCNLEDTTAECSLMTGSDVLEGYNIPDQSVWGDVCSLIALSLLFRLLGLVALHFSVHHR